MIYRCDEGEPAYAGINYGWAGGPRLRILVWIGRYRVAPHYKADRYAELTIRYRVSQPRRWFVIARVWWDEVIYR